MHTDPQLSPLLSTIPHKGNNNPLLCDGTIADLST